MYNNSRKMERHLFLKKDLILKNILTFCHFWLVYVEVSAHHQIQN